MRKRALVTIPLVLALSGCIATTPTPTPTPTPTELIPMPPPTGTDEIVDSGETAEASLRSALSAPDQLSLVDQAGDSSAPWILLEAPAQSSKEITFAFLSSSCDQPRGVDLVEEPDSVTVAVVTEPDDTSQACTGTLSIRSGKVTLAAPLGERKLVHAATTADYAGTEGALR